MLRHFLETRIHQASDKQALWDTNRQKSHEKNDYPDLDAHLFFDPDEIRAAYLPTKTLAPAQSKLNKVLRLIARLGGFLARKGDDEPGAETIWKGLTTVRIAAETMRLLRDDGDSDTCV